ncbi:MAG: NAD-dependent epimerase/dehydratase family protein [Comamonadaceae bacterium]|nr:NAD-dependent epimerase/dehydratase family protein [Comamonadaceae bacterium]
MQGLRNFLFFSSGEIYGEVARDDVPTPETYTGLVDHLSPRACYVEAKRFAETLCRFYHSQYGIPVTMIRLIHAFGPGFREMTAGSGPISSSALQSEEDHRDPERREGGAGFLLPCRRGDADHGRSLRGAAGEVYNIGSDELTSILRLASVVAAVAGDDVTIDVKNRLPPLSAAEPSPSCPSIEKVRRPSPLPEDAPEEGGKGP